MGKHTVDSTAGTERSGPKTRWGWDWTQDWTRFRVWLVVAVVVAVGGVAGAALVASSMGRAAAHQSRQAFASSSGAVASTLRLEVEREQDLVVNAAGFFLENPKATSAEFRAWSQSVQALARFPELDGWGEVLIVPASKLAAFEANAIKHPGTPLGPDGKFQLIPPGKRPYYCLLPAGQERNARLGAPPGFDFCAGSAGPVNLRARDSGRGVYSVINTGGGNVLGVVVPFYRGGAVPATVSARRKAFVGWVGMGFDPKVVLAVALARHPGMAVALRFKSASSNVSFRAGSAPKGSQAMTIDLYSGWTVETFGAVAAGGVFANTNAFGLLLSGVALSLVLALLILVLGTGARARCGWSARGRASCAIRLCTTR